MGSGFRRLFRYFVLALCGLMLAGIAHADTPAPIMAIGFENPDMVKQVFGAGAQLVPGRQGNGLAGGRFTLKNQASAEQGTFMAWLKLTERNPRGGFQLRWLRLDKTQIGPLGGTYRPQWFGLSEPAKVATLIEAGDWHHWACVWNGMKCRLFLDGIQVQEGELKQPFATPPVIDMLLVENGSRWVLDDMQIYAQALTAAQIISVRDQTIAGDSVPRLLLPEGKPIATAGAPSPCPVAYDERQLVVNPAFASERNDFPAGFIPNGWSVGKGADAVKTDANGAACTPSANEPVSILATLKRGMLISGRVYQIGVYYRLKSHGGRVLLRFRNQIDMGSTEFALPESDWQRLFFFAKTPEDYDMGIYYLETLVEGAGVEFGLRGLYCREATPDEIKKTRLSIDTAAIPLPASVAPDERWIEELPADTRFLPSVDRKAAWSAGTAGFALADIITQEGNALWFERSPREIWDRLCKAHAQPAGGIPRLAVTRATSPVPGGNGLNPLPARSVYAAALLFGIGAVDTGIGSYAYHRLQQMLESAGYFDETTAFLPFWDQPGLYLVKQGGNEAKPANDPQANEPRDTATTLSAGPPDFAALFSRRRQAPLFAHTAPGVLVSGYRHANTLLLIVVNTTNQELGKLGNLWVDHARVFGVKKAGTVTATDLETGVQARVAWNRNSGGFIADYWFNVAIAPGDYRLILVERH